jgi:hypothetical protein
MGEWPLHVKELACQERTASPSAPAGALAAAIGAGMAASQHSPGGIVARISARNTKGIRNKSYNRKLKTLSTKNHWSGL